MMMRTTRPDLFFMLFGLRYGSYSNICRFVILHITSERYVAVNTEHLREIQRVIASAVIISSDGKVLMGKKDPAKGGVYPDAWHIPGGGLDDGETLEQALIREIGQEVVGLDVTRTQYRELPLVGHGSSTKTLPSGERVWCNMEFHRFEVRLDKPAAELVELKPGDDLVELRWFGPDELADVQQIPGGREFFIEAGYLKSTGGAH
jgi:8-oxo-dGTP pyrophosphatase MutT (NUDIX family)